MAVIVKQSIQNTIFSFIGIAIGAIYTMFLVPDVFSNNPGEWGLVQLLNSYILLFMPFALLGFPNIIIKYWPGIDDSRKNAFSFFLLLLILTGLVIVSLLIFVLKKQIFFNKTASTSLMGHYYHFFFVFFVIHTLFYFLLYFARVFFKTTFPTFLKDSFIKFWTFILILAYWKSLISFDYFFKLYFFGFIIQLIVLYIFIKRNTSIVLLPDFSFFKQKSLLKEIFTYGGFSLLTGATTVIVARIDLIMINKYINLDQVAFYSVALFFITALQVPARSLNTISVPIISDHFSRNNNVEVKSIYTKTASNLFLISSFILLIIFINLNEFMLILGEQFGQIKYVIIILGIGKLYEIINSLNASIIIISKYYKYEIVFQVFLLVITVITNILLIPKYGINGAALATTITIFINASTRGLFVFTKYKLQPYSLSFLKVIFVIGISVLSSSLLPDIQNIYLAMIIKSTLIAIIYISLTLLLNISEDFRILFYRLIRGKTHK